MLVATGYCQQLLQKQTRNNKLADLEFPIISRAPGGIELNRMFFENDYHVAWLSYFGGFVLFFAVLWYITRNLPWLPLRYSLRLLAAAFFLTPWYTDAEREFLSPAWLMTMFEGVFEDDFERAGLPLALSMTLSLILLLATFALIWYLRGRAPRKTRVRKTPTLDGKSTRSPSI